MNQTPETIPYTELINNNSYPEKVKQVIHIALDLTHKNLGYLYGSANPNATGMDCSGTIYYILRTVGIKDVPRSSHLIYKWALENGHFYPVNTTEINSTVFSHLNPGDLLFWNGTYKVKHDPDVTHVMLYLGKTKDGKPLMVGSSNGRTYKGKKIYGVSVFDFQLPDSKGPSRFLGYGCAPGINC